MSYLGLTGGPVVSPGNPFPPVASNRVTVYSRYLVYYSENIFQHAQGTPFFYNSTGHYRRGDGPSLSIFLTLIFDYVIDALQDWISLLLSVNFVAMTVDNFYKRVNLTIYLYFQEHPVL